MIARIASGRGRRGVGGPLVRRGDALEAEVEGSEPAPYQVRVAFDAGGVAWADGSCPYTWGGWCKHIVAALLACIEQPGEIEERPPLDALLANLDRDQLRGLLLRLVEREPRLTDVVEGEIALLAAAPASGPPAAAPTSPEPAARQRRTPVDVGAVRREVRALVRGLDRLRPSQAYWEVGATVGEVGGVLDQARAFIEADDGGTALAILEAITEEYLALWEGLDDSDGEASGFFEELGSAWTEALLSADLTPEEREDWADKLAAWQDDLDDYGVDEAFAAAIEAARQRWDYPPLLRVFQGEITERGAWEGEPADCADELAAARLNVLERRGRYEDYLHLAEAEGQTARYVTMLVRLGRAQEAVAYGLQYLATTDEALALAQALRERGEVESALKVGDHGLTLQGSKAPLATWVRDVAAAAGETALALRAAQIAFREELNL